MCRVFCWQVFLKYLHVEQLNVAVNEFARRITACQKYVRRFTAQRRYADMKKMAKKCEEDMQHMNDIVRQLTDSLKPLQKKLQDEDAKNQEEKVRAEEKRIEDEKRIAAEQKKLEEEKKIQEQKEQEDIAAVWQNSQCNYAVGIIPV